MTESEDRCVSGDPYCEAGIDVCQDCYYGAYRWVDVVAFVDPPAAPEGYETEVERDNLLGVITRYRYVRRD